jgi:hypothetical protein
VGCGDTSITSILHIKANQDLEDVQDFQDWGVGEDRRLSILASHQLSNPVYPKMPIEI